MTPSNLLREIADAMDRGGKWWEEFEWKNARKGKWAPYTIQGPDSLMSDVWDVLVMGDRSTIKIRRIPRPEVWPG